MKKPTENDPGYHAGRWIAKAVLGATAFTLAFWGIAAFGQRDFPPHAWWQVLVLVWASFALGSYRGQGAEYRDQHKEKR